MLSQQKADIDLLTLFKKIVTLVVLLLVLSCFAFSYFGQSKQVDYQSIKTEHNRLLNILGVIRSQWLIKGKPKQLKLDWHSDFNGKVGSVGYILMADGGWPLPSVTSVAGCRDLIEELLGAGYIQKLVTEFNLNTGVCRYIGADEASISYQLTSGRVIFLTGVAK